MKSITIHKLDNELYASLVKLAEQRSTSINRLVKGILKDSLGLGDRNKKKRDLSFHVGSMSEQEVKEFEDAISVFDEIDESE